MGGGILSRGGQRKKLDTRQGLDDEQKEEIREAGCTSRRCLKRSTHVMDLWLTHLLYLYAPFIYSMYNRVREWGLDLIGRMAIGLQPLRHGAFGRDRRPRTEGRPARAGL